VCPPQWKIIKETYLASGESSGPMLFSAAFGTHVYGDEGYDGEFFVLVYNKSNFNIDDIPGLSGSQFDDKVVKKEDIKINGLLAEKITITTPSVPMWALEKVVIEKGNRVYVIHDGAIKSSLFNDFYKSFNLN
jgi:hypothetical protein